MHLYLVEDGLHDKSATFELGKRLGLVCGERVCPGVGEEEGVVLLDEVDEGFHRQSTVAKLDSKRVVDVFLP